MNSWRGSDRPASAQSLPSRAHLYAGFESFEGRKQGDTRQWLGTKPGLQINGREPCEKGWQRGELSSDTKERSLFHTHVSSTCHVQALCWVLGIGW